MSLEKGESSNEERLAYLRDWLKQIRMPGNTHAGTNDAELIEKIEREIAEREGK